MSSLFTCESEIANDDLHDKYTTSTVGALDNSGDINSLSYRLQISHCSSISNDSEVSSLSLCLDKELECHANNIDNDELPAFEIRLISPMGRTPSPIDNEELETPTKTPYRDFPAVSHYPSDSDYVTLQDINAQISPPNDRSCHDNTCLSRTSSLETIFEGVFLNTPPRQRNNLLNHRRSRSGLLEKVALNRLHIGKENKSPSTNEDTKHTICSSLDLSTSKQQKNRCS